MLNMPDLVNSEKSPNSDITCAKKNELDAFSKDTNVARMYCRPYPWGCMLITPVHALKHELSSGSMPLKLNTARVAIEACTRDSYWSDSYEFLDAFELV